VTTRLVADAVVTCDDAMTVHEPGVVDIVDDAISWVGTSEAAPALADSAAVRNIGGLLLPGLVNTHAHTPMTLMRGAGDDLPLLRWLTEVMWPREGLMTPDDARWGMTLGSAEMLLAGVTTSCEMYLFEEALIEAVAQSGARLVMTPGVLSILHAESFGAGRSRMDTIAEVHEAHHDPDGRITVGVAPHSAYDLGIDHCAELAELARDLDTVLHLHLAETRHEADELEAAHGGVRTVQLLADAGVFDGRVLAAHGIWFDESDLKTLGECQVAVAHCPVSNLKLGSGIAPVAAMQALGMTVGLGTDGPASNDTLDLWEEVKLAPMLVRVAAHDPTAMSAAQALQMATRVGAAALGLPDVGHLSPGAKADIVRLDLDHLAFSPVTNPSELLAHVVWAGCSRNVTDVWVAGRQVVADSRCETVDVGEARAQVQERALRLARESRT
jgi:5-methylthioadenosine/S-adenosylhomocysteine deaminase